MANKGEQVKLVIEYMYVSSWCGWACSCGHVEIQIGTYADGSTPTRMCSYLLGNVIIYSHVGHSLKIQLVYRHLHYMEFRASYTVLSRKETVSDGKKSQGTHILSPAKCR